MFIIAGVAVSLMILVAAYILMRKKPESFDDLTLHEAVLGDGKEIPTNLLDYEDRVLKAIDQDLAKFELNEANTPSVEGAFHLRNTIHLYCHQEFKPTREELFE